MVQPFNELSFEVACREGSVKSLKLGTILKLMILRIIFMEG